MSYLRGLCTVLMLILTVGLSGQSCPEEGPFNDTGRYTTYGGVTTSTVADQSGICGEAIRIVPPSTAPGTYSAGFQTSAPGGLTDAPGKRYRFSFRYRGDANRNVIVQLLSRERQGTATDTYGVDQTLAVTTTYQTHTFEVTSIRSLGDTEHYFYLVLFVGESTVPLHLDNVVMEEIDCTEGNFSGPENYSGYGGVTFNEVRDAAGSCGDAVRVDLDAVKPFFYSAGFDTRQATGLVDTAGTTFRVSFRYRAASDRQLFLRLASRPLNTFGSDDFVYTSGPLDATTTYQTYTTTFTSIRQPGEVDHRLYFLIMVGESTVPVYLDDIVMEEVECTAEGAFNTLSKWNTYDNAADATISAAEVFDTLGTCRDAFRISLTGTPGGHYSAGFQIRQNDGQADEAGKDYRVSFRYRADAPRSVPFTLRSRKIDTYGTDDTKYAAATLSATTDYQTYSTVFRSVREAGDLDYRLYLLLAAGGSTVPFYLDDIVMEELPPHHTSPTTIYVSPLGDDANTGLGLSPDQALRTLSFALPTLIPGDVLLVDDGVYAEDKLRLEALKATAANPVTIRSINPWGAKLEGTDSYKPVLQLLNSDHITVEGFEVYNPLGDGSVDWSSGIQILGSNHVTLRNNYVHDCGCNGISGREGDYLTVERNVVRDNAKTSPYNCSGISIYQPTQLDAAAGPHIVIRQNVAFENECRLPFTPQGFDRPTDGNGIILDDFNHTQDGGTPYTAGVVVENNLSFSNGGAGIKAFELQDAILRNNTVYQNNYVLEEVAPHTAEIDVQGFGGSVEVYNNVAHQATGQAGHALSVQDYGQGGSLTAQSNLWLGSVYQRGGALTRTDELEIAVSQQSYTAFGDALAPVPAFTSVDDFRPLFGLRNNSPALNSGNDALAPATDLTTTTRPQNGTTDRGAFEGAVAAGGALPADGRLLSGIPATPQPITIDGKREGYYTGIRHPLLRSLLTTPDATTNDLSASWTATWSADSLFVFVEVIDDILLNDGVSLFIDAGNEQSGSYDANDRHLVLDYNRATAFGRSVTTADGYAAEFGLSWSELGLTATDSFRFGLEVIVTDDDGGDSDPEHRIAWQSAVAGAETDPSLFGEGQLLPAAEAVYIPYTASRVTIDGFGGSPWRGSPIHTLDHQFYRALLGDQDLAGDWRALWDEDHLYLLIRITDDSLHNDSPGFVNDDNVEVFLDTDNSKDASYGPNDYLIYVEYQQNAAGIPTDAKRQLGEGTKAFVRDRDGGYRVELAIPWSALAATPLPGLYLGIDVHINDDDSGGKRESKRAWYATADNSFLDPSIFGTAYLAPPGFGPTLPDGCVEAEIVASQAGDVHEFPGRDIVAGNALRYRSAGSLSRYVIKDQAPGLHTLTLRARTGGSGNFELYLDGNPANRIRVRAPRGEAVGEWRDYTSFVTLPEGVTTLEVRSREADLLELNYLCVEPGHPASVAQDR